MLSSRTRKRRASILLDELSNPKSPQKKAMLEATDAAALPATTPCDNPPAFTIDWPVFPEEYRDKLPSNFTEQQKQDLSGCFCPTCAKELWDCIPKHARLDTFDDIHKWNIAKGGAKCDVRDLLSCFMASLEPLRKAAVKLGDKESGASKNLPLYERLTGAGGMDPHAARTVDALFQELSHIAECMKQKDSSLPDLWKLASYTNTLFFDGSVGHISYQWADLENMKGHVGATLFGSERKSSVIAVLVNTQAFYGWSLPHSNPKDRALELLGIILHEQVHVYLGSYVCRGLCKGRVAGRQLCTFLNAKMAHMFTSVSYNGKSMDCGRLAGHGPAFSGIAQGIAEVMVRVLALWLPSARTRFQMFLPYANPCKCEGDKGCLLPLHCFPELQRITEFTECELIRNLVKEGFAPRQPLWVFVPFIELSEFARWYAEAEPAASAGLQLVRAGEVETVQVKSAFRAGIRSGLRHFFKGVALADASVIPIGIPIDMVPAYLDWSVEKGWLTLPPPRNLVV